MPGPEVRLLRRDDRDQLTRLVNAHVQCVVPGVSVSVNAVLSQVERDPGEFIVDPWVAERATLVAEQRGRVVAAAHLLRYRDDDSCGDAYRGTGEIRWLLCWPDAPFWPDASAAGDAVAAAAVAYLVRSGARLVHADGTLPAPGVYGVTEQWPHVRATLTRAGFTPGDRTEVVLVADVGRIPRPPAPVPGLAVARSLGACGTRLTATLDGEDVGHVEVEIRGGDVGRLGGHAGWADVGNLHVAPSHRGRGVAGWLLGHAADWLHLGHADRLLDYADPQASAYLAVLARAGFTELTRTTRGWVLDPAGCAVGTGLP